MSGPKIKKTIYTHPKAPFINDKNGTPIQLIGTVQDITQSEQLRQSLEKSTNFYRTLEETLPDAIGMIDSTGKIIHSSTPLLNLTQYPQNELINKDAIELLLPQKVKKNAYVIIRDLNPSQLIRMELLIVQKSGKKVWTEFLRKGIFDKHTKALNHIVFSIRDICKQKKLFMMNLSQTCRTSYEHR